MRFQHVIEQVYFHPWYITPAGHAAIHAVLESRLGITAFSPSSTGIVDGVRPPRADIDFSDFTQTRRKMSLDRDGIATIHILGPLGKGLSKMEKSCGATDFADIQQDYRDAVASGARGILLDFNSPGGTVAGTPETADLVASKAVPTVAHVDELMASAAYFIAAGADSIVASPSAMVGSIGVYIPWVDYSAAIKARGLRPDPIVNAGGDLKALGFGGTLSDSQRAHLQDWVDTDFAAFQGHVRAFRDVPDSAMRGQLMKGQTSLDSSLIDQVGDMSAARAKLMSMIRR